MNEFYSFHNLKDQKPNKKQKAMGETKPLVYAAAFQWNSELEGEIPPYESHYRCITKGSPEEVLKSVRELISSEQEICCLDEILQSSQIQECKHDATGFGIDIRPLEEGGWSCKTYFHKIPEKREKRERHYDLNSVSTKFWDYGRTHDYWETLERCPAFWKGQYEDVVTGLSKKEVFKKRIVVVMITKEEFEKLPCGQKHIDF